MLKIVVFGIIAVMLALGWYGVIPGVVAQVTDPPADVHYCTTVKNGGAFQSCTPTPAGCEAGRNFFEAAGDKTTPCHKKSIVGTNRP